MILSGNRFKSRTRRKTTAWFGRLAVLLAWMSVTTAGRADAAEGPVGKEARFGVGVSYWQAGVVYFPIRLSRKLRLEPEFSLSWAKSRYVSDDNYESRSSSTQLRVGSGLFYVRRVGSVSLLYGARGGWKRERYSSGNDGRMLEQTEDGFYLASCLGMEYFLVDQVSVGAEVQFEYSRMGRDINQGDAHDAHESSHSLVTQPLLSIRWYPGI